MVAELQRAFLELVAAVRYLEEFKPIFDGTALNRWQAVLPVIGAVIHDMNLAEMYHQVGILFWLIRPFEEVARTRVDSLSSPQSPLGCMSLVPARRSRTLFEERVDHPDKFIAIWKYYRESSMFSVPYTATVNLNPMPTRKPKEGLASKIL